MRFLIDGSGTRIAARLEQWADGVGGQLITPLTGYRKAAKWFAIDNGAYTNFREDRFRRILIRDGDHKKYCAFVAVPDKVGCHKTTMQYWDRYNHMADGWTKAFVAQDGYDGLPDGARALFIGGTNSFKDSDDAISAVRDALMKGLHVHIGRVNESKRYIKFRLAGAHTCDGSGISRYDHMLPAIRDAWNAL